MNYIGSKLKLCQDFLPNTIKKVCGSDLSRKTFCDIFAGTGIVARTFKSKVKKVIANDVEYYSFVLNRNYIGNCEAIENKAELIEELNNATLIEDGFIYKNYCIGGSGKRVYFSDYNGKKIDTIRTKIEEWKSTQKISSDAYYFLLCSLLESADKCANTASVYGAYLKKLKATAKKNLILEAAEYEVTENECEVFQADANALIKKIEGDILYLDPPYNARQYGANYHLLNTIARYKEFEPRGKTGLPEYYRSKYCSKFTVLKEFEELIKNAHFKYIFLSYNNEGLMTTNDIKAILSRYGAYDLVKTEYQRFKADSSRYNKADNTVEYVHILVKN